MICTLKNAVLWDKSPDTTDRINIAVTANDSTRVQNRIAAHFDSITENCAKLFSSGRDGLRCMNYI
jgi:hypothetical protein